MIYVNDDENVLKCLEFDNKRTSISALKLILLFKQFVNANYTSWRKCNTNFWLMADRCVVHRQSMFDLA